MQGSPLRFSLVAGEGPEMIPVGSPPPGRWGPESAELLRLAEADLHAARRALARPLISDDDVQSVRDALADTDDLFAHLVACWELDGSAAQRIERVRDELSGHLLAVEALTEAGKPTVGVLRRAVESAWSEVGAVLVTPVVASMGIIS
jgi:hypothetical protein